MLPLIIHHRHTAYLNIPLKIEKYLDCVKENKYRIALSRFRTSSHDLLIETCRYDGIPRENRICKSCKMRKSKVSITFFLYAQENSKQTI